MTRIPTNLTNVLVDSLRAAIGAGVEGADRLLDAVVNQQNPTLDPLDVIADLLASPKARWVLNTQTLNTMREAILNPRELATLRAHARQALGCNKCGRAMQNHELATLIEQNIYCASCVLPVVHACSGCRNVLPFNAGLSRIVGKACKECDYCMDAKSKGIAPTPPPEPVPEPPGVRGDDRRGPQPTQAGLAAPTIAPRAFPAGDTLMIDPQNPGTRQVVFGGGGGAWATTQTIADEGPTLDAALRRADQIVRERRLQEQMNQVGRGLNEGNRAATRVPTDRA